MPITTQIQLGKKKITENFIENLKRDFKKNKNIKISVLKSACRNREEIKKIKEKILENLGKNYSGRIIGFTIALKKNKK
jgi:RNA-binding protein YhbY